jgi:hypothetical protein
MESDSIIDSRLFVRLDLDVSLKANSLFQTNPNNRAHLASQLLLYDKIIIPTKDFGIVPILINWLGLRTFIKALESDTFSFLHRKSLIGYAGNGTGISEIIISGSEANKMSWWQDAMFGEIDVAVEQQLRNMCPFISRQERARVVEEIISKSRDVDYDNDFFIRNVRHETYIDIMKNTSLSLLLFVVQGSKHESNKIDLRRLKGVGPNQIRVLGLEGIKDPVDLVLRIAEINTEIYMSTLSNDADLFTSDGAELLLKDKLIRAGVGSNYLDGFLSLLELNNIPDIGKAITNDSIALLDIWKLRERRISRNFRKWLRKATNKDARDIEKLYVESLGNKALTDSLPLRAIRFAMTSIASAESPAMGLAFGVVDSFFVNKWLSGYSPKVFLDELSRIRIEK